MTRRIRRFPEFEIALTINQDSFIRPPREGQRNWMMNRAIAELADELWHLNRVAPTLIAGGEPIEMDDRTQAALTSEEIMEDWQIPIMRAMAEFVTQGHGDILEIGFGRGVSATLIQELGVRSHTIVECNDQIVANYREWRDRHARSDVRLLHGRWQDVLQPTAKSFDAVFFHTYPLTAEEHAEFVVKGLTFAAHFFPVAANCLRPDGVFTYLTNEADSLGRGHQRLLFENFREVTLSQVGPLDIPDNSRDAMWANSMVVVKAVK